MKQVRVIGVGSPFGADRLGWCMVERLRADPRLEGVGPRLALLLRDRPGMALLQDLRDAGAVLLVDAVAGGVPGTLVQLPRSALLAEARPLSTHGTGVAEALLLGQALGWLPQRLELWGLETGDGHRLPEPEAMERLYLALWHRLQDLLAEEGGEAKDMITQTWGTDYE